jgi:hypothetical protein
MLYQIDVGYACAGIVIEEGVVTVTAPIFTWMIGKGLPYIEQWVKSKGGTIIECRSSF